MSLLLHAGAPLMPHDLWQAWSLEPVVLGGLAAAMTLYAAGLRRLWRRSGPGRGVPPWRAWCFAAGILALAVALVSPLDALGTALQSAHMAQHLVLMIPASLLLVLGAPVVPMLHALPRSARRAVGHTWGRFPALRAAATAVVRKPVVWLLNVGVLWAWHAPQLYDAALGDEVVHALEHASFLGVSLLLWGAVFPPSRRRAARGAGILLLVATAMQGGLLAAMLVFADRPWYASYATSPVRWGFSPLEDQQLAGAIMWVPAGTVYLAAATALFLAWIRRPRERPTTVRRVTREVAEERLEETLAPPLPRPLSHRGGTAAVLLVLGAATACSPDAEASAMAMVPGGVPATGKALIRAYGCGNCHLVPGIRAARGTVGPPLTAFAERDLLAGKFQNTPENLIPWIMNAPAMDPGVAMPNLGLDAEQSRHIAAYLYTLR